MSEEIINEQKNINPIQYVKLSEYAKVQGIPYRTAFDWWNQKKLKGYQNSKGSIFIEKGSITNNDNSKNKLISQKYFMNMVNENSCLSNVANFIFGCNDESYKYVINIDYTDNIDIILDKTKLWLTRSFEAQIFQRLFPSNALPPEVKPEVINKNFLYSDIFINNIIEQIKDKHICLILASKAFKSLLKTSPFYKKEDNTFYNIPIIENMACLDRQSLPPGVGCFIDKTNFIDFYIKSMPFILEQDKKKYTLSTSYHSVIDNDVNIYRFYFTFGSCIIDKHPVDIIDEKIKSIYSNLSYRILSQLESHYYICAIFNALKVNNKLFELIRIRIERDKLIIDDLLEISFFDNKFVIKYDDAIPFRLASIENVLTMIKLYKNQIEQFDYLIKHNDEKEEHRTSDGILEILYSNMPQRSDIDCQSIRNSIFGQLLKSIDDSPIIRPNMSNIKLIPGGIIIGNISIDVDELNLNLTFTDLQDDAILFYLRTCSHAIVLIELYFKNKDVFMRVISACTLIKELHGEQLDSIIEIENILASILDSDISNITNKIKEYFMREKNKREEEVSHAISMLMSQNEEEEND